MNMRKLRLYLDTSVISDIDAPHAPDLEAITKEFFRFTGERKSEYELCISPVGVSEIENSPEPKRSQFVDFIRHQNILILPDSEDALILADLYVEAKVLSEKHLRDLSHIAFAVVYRCDYIVSWNMKHFVKPKTISGVHAVNLANNYMSPFIVTPTVILGDKHNEND